MRSAHADFLKAVPVFAGLPDEMRSELAAGGTRVSIDAGHALFREGDAADALFVVLSGRLEAVVEEPVRQVLRVLTRGAVLGELAILADAPRSASVIARRDADLLRIGREHFERLLAGEPGFAVALTRELGRQLQESKGLPPATPPVPAVISIVPLAGGPAVDDLARGLEEGLGAWRSTALLERPGGDDLDNGSMAAYAALLDSAQREREQVLLVAREPDGSDPWTAFCIREADRVLALAGPGELPAWAQRHGSLQGCDVVLADTGPPLGPGLDPLAPRAVHVVPEGAGRGAGLGRLARRLGGRSIGLVLSGGGARGFAHVGVIEELRTEGVAIDRVAGTSMGSFIAGLLASGRSLEEVGEVCRREFVARNPLDDYTVPVASLTRGRKARAMILRCFGETLIEELPCEFFCVSCDLVASELVVHRHGSAAHAIGASMSLPGVVPPLAHEGRLLVDGGVLNNLPVELMASRGEGPVIAVDVTSRFEAAERPGRFARPRTRRLARRVRTSVVGDDAPLPSVKETLIAAMTLGSIDTAEAAQRHADLVITPDVSAFGLLEWAALDRLREEGRRAAREVLDASPAQLSG